MPYTISDVAQKAGVSTATVSKVINNKMYVSPKTREKVLKVMNELNYTPNASAASLAKQTPETFYMRTVFTKVFLLKIPICSISFVVRNTN